MCVAVAIPKGTRGLTESEIRKGWDKNPDGGGLAYVNEEGRIVTFKSMKLKPFLAEYNRVQEKYGASSHILVHMRIATHGAVKIENNHPYDIRTADGEAVLIHNGMIHHIPDAFTNEDTSDTKAFIQHVIDYMADDWMDSPEMVNIVEQYIGWSKLAILTTSESAKYGLYIVNEDMGLWDDGVWFSNQSCQAYSFPKKQKVATGFESFDDWADRYYKDEQSPKRTYTYAAGWDEEEEILADMFCDPSELRALTIDEYYTLLDVLKDEDVACKLCTGMSQCHCDDICYACYESWWSCDCSGNFESLSDYQKSDKKYQQMVDEYEERMAI